LTKRVRKVLRENKFLVDIYDRAYETYYKYFTKDEKFLSRIFHNNLTLPLMCLYDYNINNPNYISSFLPSHNFTTTCGIIALLIFIYLIYK